MKIVIDIPEKALDVLKNDGVDWLGAEHILDAVSKGIPYEEKTQGEWSPVSAQEPDVGGLYLVTAKDVSGHIGVDLARRISKDVWTFGGEELPGTEIIAWQPTPEPYKESEE
jgi:hypothetical protein